MIPVKNVYYMLSYAFKTLNEQGYKRVETEEFHNVAELCAAILSKGVALQIKRGLGREYISETEELSTIRGKIDITESVKSQSLQRKKAVCTYDIFSVDSYMNRIIKTTMIILLKSKISLPYKKELRKLLVFFGDVEEIDVRMINWNIHYNRNNQTYQMLISICFLVVKGLLQTQSDGTTKVMDFIDEQRMHRLFERFILEYYRKEFPEISVNASQIPWKLDDDFDEMLPVMQSDITLSYEGRTLIIDAKYYSHSLQEQYNKYTIHSGNLYQIFTYVKNKETSNDKEDNKVAGMILYAKTDEEVYPDNEYRMSGNLIVVRTLDLGGDFNSIKEQLNYIAEKYLGVTI